MTYCAAAHTLIIQFFQLSGKRGRGPQALAALQAKENRLLLKEQAVLVTRTRIELVLQP